LILAKSEFYTDATKTFSELENKRRKHVPHNAARTRIINKMPFRSEQNKNKYIQNNGS